MVGVFLTHVKFVTEVLELWLAFFQAVIRHQTPSILWICHLPCGFQGFRAYLHQAGAKWQELEGYAWECCTG